MSREQTSNFLKGRAFFILALVLGNAIAWLIPSNVVKLVARERHVLLGHYSRTHFSWLLAAALMSAIAILIRCAPTPRRRRRRAFAVLACALGLVPALVGADVALRLMTKYPYAPDAFVYHRPPHAKYDQPYDDLPAAKRSYARTPKGFGHVECVMTFDAQGFRNKEDRDQSDVVTLGDSFTEGSRVSDDQTWPVRLETLTGRSVCNLGISGYSPQEYLASLKHYGIAKKPKLVLCMLYEGNDFRSARTTVKSGVTFKQVVATSPLIVGLNDWMIDTFGPIGSTGDVRGLDVLSWLPIAIPEGPNARHYAFAPKQLFDLCRRKQRFAGKRAWRVTRDVIREMQRACSAAGARLVIVYAPVKAHVVFPLAADRLPVDKVRVFCRLRSKKRRMPEDDRFMEVLLGRLSNLESLVAEWCAEQSIPFVSLTEPLRREVAAGRQVYYTYDQHWTPLGHEAAARAVAAFLEAHAPPPPDKVAATGGE